MSRAGRSYYTIDTAVGETVTAEITVKRSVFLCWLRRVESEEAARSLLDESRAEFPDARHHCSAWVLGHDSALRRSADDGEPAGTAGRPMLEVLTGRAVSDVAAVVTRWFGGTLLGTGGLIRAYSDATTAALDSVEKRRRALLHHGRVSVEMSAVGAFEHRLRQAVEVTAAEYGQQATFSIATSDTNKAEADVANWTTGNAAIEWTGTLWHDVGR